MECKHHFVDVDYRHGHLYCPYCTQRFTNEEAKQCLREILVWEPSVEFVFNDLMLTGESIRVDFNSKAMQLSLSKQRLRLQKEFTNMIKNR